MPVAFVAIRRLRIHAEWTPEDVGSLEQSLQFGPFNIDSTVEGGAIGHDGTEVGTGSGQLAGGKLTYRYESGPDSGTCVGELGPDGKRIAGTCSSGGDSWTFGIWR